MDQNTPALMPILSAGAHSSPAEGACVMEMASYLAGEKWSARPACTHPALARAAQVVNDRLPDDERGVLLDLLPRLMGTTPTGTPDEQRRLSTSLAVWCAEQVVHFAGEAEPQAREAIRVTRAWLAGEATPEECRSSATYAANAAYAVSAATYAANAAYAVSATTSAAYAANAATYATYATNAYDGDASLGLLSGLIDEYDRLTGRTESTPLSVADTQRLAALTA